MTLNECLLIRNDCYAKNVKMNGGKPMGIVMHSTGANNKTLKRYVQPVPEQMNYTSIIADLGKNKYGNDWNRSGLSKCVHAFIGVNGSGKVETYQTLPWDVCCWGCGNGSKGSFNFNPTARIQFEICEDAMTDAAYFAAAMREAQELCAFLCKLFALTPDKICSHSEAHALGYGSDHGDPDYWLKKHGKSMAWFRAETQKILNGKEPQEDYDVKEWKNGSTKESVYATTDDCRNAQNSIGWLDPHEAASCYGIVDGCYMVCYNITKNKKPTGNEKVGFVAYHGGIK